MSPQRHVVAIAAGWLVLGFGYGLIDGQLWTVGNWAKAGALAVLIFGATLVGARIGRKG